MSRAKFFHSHFSETKRPYKLGVATNEHRVAQAKGRGEIFANYRLRVAGVIRDYGMREREQVPGDSLKIHGA